MHRLKSNIPLLYSSAPQRYNYGMDASALTPKSVRQAACLYMPLYRIMGRHTPLRFDCGRLCQRACCLAGEQTNGMYLFPGEELLCDTPGFAIQKAPLPGYGEVSLLTCGGTCARDTRPLACRLFPLAPAWEQGRVQVRLDARGRAICPLCTQHMRALDPRFIRAAQRVYARLANHPATTGFVQALCAHLDAFEAPLL